MTAGDGLKTGDAGSPDMNRNVESKTEMLVRKPVAEVFEAFVDPGIPTQFWFTKSSGRLEAGKRVTWEWEMYGVSTEVLVRDIEKDRRILIEWSGYKGHETVEWTFEPHGKAATFVRITNSGFKGSDDEIVAQALDSKGGFTWLLAGLKAFLEFGVKLNLTADAHPKGLESG